MSFLKFLKYLLPVIVALLRLQDCQAAPAASPPDDLQTVARHIATERDLPDAAVWALLQDARVNTRVAQLIAATGMQRQTPRAWPLYRQRYVEPIRIRGGVAFWRAQAATLAKAQARYGVPAAVIVAIIGVETLYGRQTGDFRVLDTLVTLALHYPEPQRPDRVQLFRDQLADLVELHLTGQLDATTLHGSFAGAVGVPQFMPGSIKRYAVDGDGDGRIDLHGSAADVVMSVANFLRAHGWLPGLPVFAPLRLPANPAALVTEGLTATRDWLQLQTAGAQVITRADAANNMVGDMIGTTRDTRWQRAPLGVIALIDERPGQHQTQAPNPTEYRVATPNFFALTHYNRSYFYAAAVADLAAALQQRMDEQTR